MRTDLVKGRDVPLDRIGFHLSGPDPREALRRQDHLGAEELATLRKRLAALDRNSRSGAWTSKALHLIGERDGRTAGEIAATLGIDKPTVKSRTRQQQALGRNENLLGGDRLSEHEGAV